MARIGWAAVALTAAALLTSLWRPGLGWPLVAIVWGVAVLSVVRPFNGLLVLAGIGPVVTALAIGLRADKAGVHYVEALTLAFIAGAAARRALSSGGTALPRRILWPAGILITLALASAAVNVARLLVEQNTAGSVTPWSLLADHLVDQNSATIALQFVEGLILFVLTAAAVAGQDDALRRVLRLMIAGATGAAVLNIVRIAMAGMEKADAGAALVTYLIQARVSVQYSDWNAAGSYFAMMLVVTTAFVRRDRLGYMACAAIIGLGLWLTGSRVAMAAVLVVGIAAALLVVRRPARGRLLVPSLAVGLAVMAAIAGAIWYPSVRNDPVMFSISTRWELWKAGVQMMWKEPIFGVGLGRFYELSPKYAA